FREQNKTAHGREPTGRIAGKGRDPLEQRVAGSQRRHGAEVTGRIGGYVDLRRHRPLAARIRDERFANSLDRARGGDRGLDVPRREDRDHWALTPAISWSMDSFASPKSITVFGLTKRGFSIPAKPGFIDRLRTTTLCASSTFRMGIP